MILNYLNGQIIEDRNKTKGIRNRKLERTAHLISTYTAR